MSGTHVAKLDCMIEMATVHAHSGSVQSRDSRDRNKNSTYSQNENKSKEIEGGTGELICSIHGNKTRRSNTGGASLRRLQSSSEVLDLAYQNIWSCPDCRYSELFIRR